MREIIELITQMSPYLLLGFLLAGVMHAFVPKNIYNRYLGDSSFRSVFYAAMFGVPLPLCSCGVIPTAISLRREGASKGAAVSFLTATPQTGIDSIIATYSLMGLPFALLRPVAAIVTALFGGTMVNLLDGKGDVPAGKPAEVRKIRHTLWQRVKSALHYGFVEMMQDIGRWLLLGLVVAGLITVFVPDEFFALFADNSLLSMLVVLLCAVPMYLCATGSIPIAVALMLKGLSPGTALVLLMAGPAVNVASMLVLGKVMGRRTLSIYLSSIIMGAMAFGLAVDYMLPREWFTTPVARISEGCEAGPSWFNVACAVLLGALLVNALVRRYLGSKDECAEGICRTTSAEYHIEGLRCNHCRANAEKAIAALEGVESVTIELASGRAVVSGCVGREQISRAVEAIGFKLRDDI